MDLGLLYGDFVMDNRELILHTAPGASSVFRDDMGATHCAITAFRNGDPDIERGPLSTNRRLFDSEGIKLFGTMVVAGLTPDVIYVLIRDSTTCTADDVSPSDLQHVVGSGWKLERHLATWGTTSVVVQQFAVSDPDRGQQSLLVWSYTTAPEVEKRQWHRMTTLSSHHLGEYFPTPACFSHRQPMLLALPGFDVPHVVQLKTQRERPSRKDT